MNLYFLMQIVGILWFFSLFWASLVLLECLLRLIQLLWMNEIDWEEYKEKMEKSHLIITQNILEDVLIFTSILFVFIGFTILGLSLFESAFIFLAPLIEILTPEAFFAIGYCLVIISQYSLFLRRMRYCLGEKND